MQKTGKIDIEGLARLARVTISEEELSALSKDMEAVLEYVSQIQGVGLVDDAKEDGAQILRNVMREDDSHTMEDISPESVLSQAPRREGSFVAVKKVL